MPQRRAVIRGLGAAAGAALVGVGASGATSGGSVDAHGMAGGADSAVGYVRSIEEVRGHLHSALTLLEKGRRSDAALHAGHGSDYFAAILPPVRDANPMLATRLRARVNGVAERVQSASAEEFATFIREAVYPLLDRAVETVVTEDVRGTTAFETKVMNALAGRIADEYSAAVTASGTIELSGEYWDARGFLYRIEQRHGGAGLGDAGSSALDRLRSEIESVAAPERVTGTTLQFRVETTAAAGLPGATVEGREDALAYVRNAEEVRGHLHSSIALAQVGSSTAGLHAGHGSDYLLALLPPVQRANPDLATRLFDRVRALDDRVASLSAAEYEEYVREDVLPVLDEAVSAVLPEAFADSTSFDAAVFLALADRVADEYDAAVTDEEVVELYGEYWDARGFLYRMEVRFEGMKGDLDGETRSEVEEELGILREELETARPPADVEGSVEALHDMLGGVAAA